MKTLVGSPEPEDDDDGPVYVVTTLGPSSDTGFVVKAEMQGLQTHRAWQTTWSSGDTFTVQSPTITFTVE